MLETKHNARTPGKNLGLAETMLWTMRFVLPCEDTFDTIDEYLDGSDLPRTKRHEENRLS